ncbi:hypothetical protein M3226_30595 [Neobacillus cucumis]|uniref:hypothetical protein n=1 Tax=Neobacillus cucumis TaxID=1740721 RepID=UPI00203DE19A|nr:hypothetical protein [Neobacillus cucumis]MCM3729875.1 hypothetical protein [Neobacillus cucumis]
MIMYEEELTILKEKGELKIPLTDVDQEFYIEDALNSLNVKYHKFIPKKQPPGNKVLVIKIKHNLN